MIAIAVGLLLGGLWLANLTTRGRRNWLDRAGDGMFNVGFIMLAALLVKALWGVAC